MSLKPLVRPLIKDDWASDRFQMMRFPPRSRTPSDRSHLVPVKTALDTHAAKFKTSDVVSISASAMNGDLWDTARFWFRSRVSPCKAWVILYREDLHPEAHLLEIASLEKEHDQIEPAMPWWAGGRFGLRWIEDLKERRLCRQRLSAVASRATSDDRTKRTRRN